MLIKRIILIALVLAAWPASAQAETVDLGGGAWTFYAYGNGVVITQVLEAIIRIVSSPGFLSVAMGLALLGFLLSGVGNLLRGQGAKFASYIAGLLVSVYMLFNVTVDIYVEEMVLNGTGSGGMEYGEMVQDVPAAIGLPIAVVSELGMWVTEALETNFIDPAGSGVPLLSDGVPFGATAGMVRDINNVRISDPDLKSNFYNYFRDCTMPKITNGSLDTHAIGTSTSIWDEIQVNSPSIYTSIQGASSPYNGVMSCEEATTVISDQISDLSPDILDQVVGGSGSLLALADESTVNAVLTGAVADSSANATSTAVQAGLIDLFRGSHEYAAMATGANEVMLSLNMEQARRSQKGGWYSTALLFQDMAGYFFAILQAFVIGLGPLILMIAFLPGLGSRVASSYGKVLLWLMLWWPGLAITNFIMITNYQSQMGQVWNGSSGPTAIGGMSLANQGLISSYTDNMLMAGAFMATLVPTIMWGIVSGAGMVFASALDRASGANYASQGASAAMAGNATMGEQRMNNTAMNSSVTTERNSAGFGPSTYDHGAGVQNRTHQLSGDNVAVGGHEAQKNTADVSSLQESKQYQEAKSANEKWGESITAMEQTVANATRAYATEIGANDSGTIDFSKLSQTEEGRQLIAANQAVADESEKSTATAGERHEESVISQVTTQMDAKLGINTDSIVSGGVSAGATASTSSRETDTEYEENATAKASGEAYSAQEGQTESSGTKNVGGEGNTFKTQFSDSEKANALESVAGSDAVSEMHNNEKAFQEAYSEYEALAESRSVSESTMVSGGLTIGDYENANEDSADFISGSRAELEAKRGQLDEAGQAQKESTNQGIQASEDAIADGTAQVDGKTGMVQGNVSDGLEETEEAAKSGPQQSDFSERFRSETFERNDAIMAAIRDEGRGSLESQLTNVQEGDHVYQPVGTTTNLESGAPINNDINDTSDGQIVYRRFNEDGDDSITYTRSDEPGARRTDFEVDANPQDEYGIMEDGQFKPIENSTVERPDYFMEKLRDMNVEDNQVATPDINNEGGAAMRTSESGNTRVARDPEHVKYTPEK